MDACVVRCGVLAHEFHKMAVLDIPVRDLERKQDRLTAD